MAVKSQRKTLKKNHRPLILYLIILPCLALAIGLYIYSRTYAKAAATGLTLTPQAFSNILSRALPALIGMSASAVVIAVVSLSFQTAVESRILTPSMIGFDSIFVGTQTLLVFFFGAVSSLFSNPYLNYLIVAGAMVIISMFMYRLILRKNRNNVVFLLMFGLVLSGIVRNISNYLQVIMDNNAFNQVKAATSVTINNMNTSIILLALPIMIAVSIAIISRHKIYDVLALGRDNAKSLGVPYEKEINLNLILISIGMSVVTAMIGSLSFLGLLAVNITRELLKTHKHLHLFLGSSAVAVFVLVLGQSAVELLQGAVPLTAIIDLFGCSYMFFLILKENHL